MTGTPSENEVGSYYHAAMLGLRYIEAQKPTGRRFGPEADARWASLKGDLTTADRLDLLIRDANAHWPGSFGARTAFAVDTVAEDEPFGPQWSPLDPVDAETLWRAQLASSAPDDLRALLTAVAAAWRLPLTPKDAGSIAPAETLVVAGPASIAGAILAFHQGGRDLSWSDQVIVVATPPAHRQLAALAGALLGATKPTTLLAATDNTDRRGRLLLSPDAAPADARLAQGLAR